MDVNGRYLSWDELRRRPPPKGLTHEAWWTNLRAARAASWRDLPVIDRAGRPFRFALSDSVQRLLHEIDRAAMGRIGLPEQVANPQIRDRYLVSSLTEEAIRSSQLEGASTTRRIAKDMLRTGRPPIDKSERMIFNNFRAMTLVREHQRDALTPARLSELHRVVTEGTLDGGDEAAGRFRTADEEVLVIDNDDGEILHVPPPAETLPARIDTMCRFANGAETEAFIHPIIRAIVLHFWVGYDHPFVDANGRTARALFYWSMLREGYWLTEFLSISNIIKKAPAQYSRAYVYSETYDNDLTYFLVHQLTTIQHAVDELNQYLDRKARELRELVALLKGRTDLNHRQLALLAHALRHPGEKYTIQAHQRSHLIVYQTARQDLLDLEAKKLLTREKLRNAFVFRAVPNLERKLTAPRSRR